MSVKPRGEHIGTGEVIREATPEAPGSVVLDDGREIPVDYWTAHDITPGTRVDIYREPEDGDPILYRVVRVP